MKRTMGTVIGIEKTSRKFRGMMKSDDYFDDLALNAMKRVQVDAFKGAPVLTGFLSSNLIANENRVRADGIPSGTWDLLDGTDYTIIQEYEHRTQSRFIRNAVETERPRFHKEVGTYAKTKLWKK